MNIKDEYLKNNRSRLFEKIENAFSVDTFSEKDVIFIVSLFRKILEYEGQKRYKNYFLLNFFCNWCLHIELVQTPNTSFFEEIESGLKRDAELRRRKHRPKINSEEKRCYYIHSISEKFVYSQDLRQQMQLILGKDVNDKQWRSFRDGLFETLLESPYKPIKGDNSFLDFLIIRKDPLMKNSNQETYVCGMIVYFVDQTFREIEFLDETSKS